MKKLFGFLLVVGALTTAFVTKEAQQEAAMSLDGGIQFEKKSLEEAMKQAKKENKLIFIDAYTEWCGPCKKMAATSFQDPQVAEYFNGKFINLKIEMEKSADGPTVAKAYRVAAYPTLLFINGDGQLVKSVIGFQTADQLSAIAKSL
jgi:thioredoxin 1